MKQIARCCKKGAGVAYKGKVSWAVTFKLSTEDEQALHAKTSGQREQRVPIQEVPGAPKRPKGSLMLELSLQFSSTRNHFSKTQSDITCWLQAFSGPLGLDKRAPAPPQDTEGPP